VADAGASGRGGDVKIDRVWVVNDPGPRSVIADICFLASPRDLLLGIVGAFIQGKERLALREAMSLYTTEEEAHADAEARLLKRGAAR
jgi:hypothetical protein